MARSSNRPGTTRRVKETVYEEPAEDILSPAEESPLEIEDPADDTIRSILSQFGSTGDIEVKVYRLTPKGKSYCYTDGRDVTEESIRENPYGGPGSYVLHIMSGGEFRMAKTVSIEAPRGAVAATAGRDDLLMRVLEQRLAGIESRLNQPQQAEPMSAVLGAAVNLINAQMQRPQETPLDQVMKMAEFIVAMRSGDSGNEWKDILAGIAREVAPAVVPALLAPQRGTPPPAAPAPEAPDGDVKMLEMELRAGIAYLKKKCMIGADPELYLALILDNADDVKFARLIHLATTQEFELFARLDTEIAAPPYLEFFRVIYDGIRSAFAESNSVAVDTRGKAGHNADAKNNGASGKAGSGKSRTA